MERVITPTNSLGEQARHSGVKEQQTSQVHNEMGVAEGQIQKADQVRKVVKVVHRNDKSKMFGGQWITLGHSVHDIVDRFGTIRVGMEVIVFYQGNIGNPANAIAFITGEEDESGPNQTLAINSMAQGFHNVLMEKI